MILTIIVMICSVYAVTVFTVFADSASYGEELMTEEFTGGRSIVLGGAKEGDEDYFAGIEGASVSFDGNNVNIRLKEVGKTDDAAAKVREIIRENNLGLSIFIYDPSVYTPFWSNGFVTVIRIILTAVSLLSICVVLRIYFRIKTPDLMILRAVGMTGGQAALLSLCETLVMYVVSLAAGMPLGAAVMRLMIPKLFSERLNNFTLAQVTYRFSSIRMITVALICLAAAVAGFLISSGGLREKRLVNYDAGNLSRRRRDVSGITAVYRRIGINGRIVYVLTIPVAVLIMLMTSIVTQPYVKRYGCDFIASGDHKDGASSIDYALIERLGEAGGVERIDYSYTNIDFALTGTEHTHDIEEYRKNRVILHILYGDDDYKGEADNVERKCLVDIKNADRFAVGDELSAECHIYGKGFTVTVAGYYDTGRTNTDIDLYVSERDFEYITGITTAPDTIYVFMKEDFTERDISEVREILSSDKSIVSFSDENEKAAEAVVLKKGVGTVAAVIGSSYIISALISLGTFTAVEIESKRRGILILYALGASKRMLGAVTGKVYLCRAAICSIICAVSGCAISNIYRLLSGETPCLYESDIMISVGVCAMLILLFIPVLSVSLYRILKTDYNDGEEDIINDGSQGPIAD